MKPSQKPGALPLDYAAELAFEIHLLRAECSQAAGNLIQQCPLDEYALEDCARLDDALARAHVLVQSAVDRIKRKRGIRRPRPR